LISHFGSTPAEILDRSVGFIQPVMYLVWCIQNELLAVSMTQQRKPAFNSIVIEILCRNDNEIRGLWRVEYQESAGSGETATDNRDYHNRDQAFQRQLSVLLHLHLFIGGIISS
jgi:hypothetical protein